MSCNGLETPDPGTARMPQAKPPIGGVAGVFVLSDVILQSMPLMIKNGQQEGIMPFAFTPLMLTKKAFLAHAQLFENTSRTFILRLTSTDNPMQIGLGKSKF